MALVSDSYSDPAIDRRREDRRAEPPRLITVSLAARRLGVCGKTIRRWIHAGTLPATRYPSGQWRIAAAAIATLQELP